MSSALIGTTINDQYLLTGVLGEGGMGIVFKAEDLNLNNRLCAIKLLKGHTTDPHEVKRFEAELQIISRLRSPHVVQVLNKGYFEGHRLYIVMELLEGEPLSTLIKREGALKVKRAMQIAKGVLAGLSEAHEYGVVHRDLKPANIFITRSRTQDEITKVLDFGIAKDTNKDDTTGLTSASMIIGTPKYMAPEQFMKQDTDQRTDLYAVGLLLYQMLAGEPPYLANSDLIPATLKSMPSEFKVGWLHLNAEPKPLPVVPPLWDLCQRLLHKEPDQRPESAAEVIAELGYILEGLDTGSGPYSVNVGGASPLQGHNYSSGEFYTTPSGQHVAVNAQMMTPPPTPPPHLPPPTPPLETSPSRPISSHTVDALNDETDFDSLEMIDLEPSTKSGAGLKIAIGALVVGGLVALGVLGANQGKPRKSNKVCFFERIEVSPPGQYSVFKQVVRAQGKLGMKLGVGRTGRDGKLGRLLQRPCDERWVIQIERPRYEPIKLTLDHEAKGEQVHKLQAKPQAASVTPQAVKSGQSSSKPRPKKVKGASRRSNTTSSKRSRRRRDQGSTTSPRANAPKLTNKSTNKSTKVNAGRAQDTAPKRTTAPTKPPKPTKKKKANESTLHF